MRREIPRGIIAAFPNESDLALLFLIGKQEQSVKLSLAMPKCCIAIIWHSSTYLTGRLRYLLVQELS